MLPVSAGIARSGFGVYVMGVSLRLRPRGLAGVLLWFCSRCFLRDEILSCCLFGWFIWERGDQCEVLQKKKLPLLSV